MRNRDARFKALGQRIARIRDERGISQSELSRMLGYTNHAHLSRVESGKKAPSLEALYEIADMLDIDISTLFADDD